MDVQQRIRIILKQAELTIPELVKILDLDESEVKKIISVMEEETDIKSRVDREHPKLYGYDILYYF